LQLTPAKRFEFFGWKLKEGVIMKQQNETRNKKGKKCMLLQCIGFFVISITLQLFAQSGSKETISVYGLKSIGIPEILASSLQEHLESNLIKYDKYSVLSRNDIEIILKENNYRQANFRSQEDCVIKVGHIVGVDKVVTGTISKVGSTYNLVLKLIDIKTTKIEASANNKYSGSIDSLLNVVELTVEELCREELVIHEEPLKQGKEDITIQEDIPDTRLIDQTISDIETDSNSVEDQIKNKTSRKGINIGIGAIIVLIGTMCCLLAF
jgi:TolB-like protein